MSVLPKSGLKRRYMVRLSLSLAVYLGSLLIGSWLQREGLASDTALWLIALATGLGMVGAFYAIGMFIVEQEDEYLKMLVVRQSLFATGFAMAIASVWGFLQEFGLVPLIALYYVPVAWFFGLGLGGLFNKLTVGDAGICW